MSNVGDKIYLLVCDDDEFNLAYIEMILLNRYEYDIVDRGIKAINMARENKYDLILMDIQMPEMDGKEAFRQIRKEGKNKTTPIAAVTAQAMKGDKESLLDMGFNAYLAKPFKEEDLVEFISKTLKQSN